MKFKTGKKTLEKARFNPLTKQIELYERLMVEDEYWIEVRNGNIFVDGYDGSPVKVKYSSVMHLGVLSGLSKVANDLTRYGFGRVSESDDMLSVDKVPPLQIMLSSEAISVC